MPDALDRGALDDLLAMSGGEPSLFAELLDAFVADAEQYAGELEAAIESGDPAALVRPAHSLKSNAMTVGATRLAELCRALEADAKAGALGPRRRGPSRAGGRRAGDRRGTGGGDCGWLTSPPDGSSSSTTAP